MSRTQTYPEWEREAVTPDSMKGYMGTMGATGGLGATQGGGGFDWKSGLGGAFAGGLIPGLLSGLFGGDSGPDPMSYLSQIPDAVKPYIEPYTKSGESALGPLAEQYGQLMQDPSAVMNKIGASYKQSPGFQFALNQALQGAGHSAATGGMAGSPMAQQQAEQIGTKLGQQDYYNYLQKAMGMYGQGLQGMQGLAGMGLEGARGLTDDIAQALAAEAQARQAEQASHNQGIGGMLGGIGSIIGAFLP